MRRLSVVWWTVCALSCSGADGTSPDMGGGSDAADLAIGDMARAPDSGGPDAPQPDLGTDDLSSEQDLTTSGFGEISGPCGGLDPALDSTMSSFVSNALDFGTDPYDDEDAARLTEGGREIIADGNAGGSSLLSEVFAYEMLARCEGAVLLKTETEVEYQNSMGKITDLLVDIDGRKIGVSVTRAVAFPFEDPYSPTQAEELLRGKLEDVQLSSANVAANDRWAKQILYVLAYSGMHADSLSEAYGALDPAVTADTVVVVTVTDGDDAPLY